MKRSIPVHDREGLEKIPTPTNTPIKTTEHFTGQEGHQSPVDSERPVSGHQKLTERVIVEMRNQFHEDFSIPSDPRVMSGYRRFGTSVSIQDAVDLPRRMTAAFQSPERVAEQKRQEFELLMQDVVYESGSSLTDLRLLEGLRGKKKKGQSVFATGFWTKLFKPPPRPGRPPADDNGR